SELYTPSLHDALPILLNNTLYYRGVQAFIINEAHHMLLMATGRKTNWSVNVLKSLAGSKTPIVMVGTYELLNYLELHSEFVDQRSEEHTSELQSRENL